MDLDVRVTPFSKIFFAAYKSLKLHYSPICTGNWGPKKGLGSLLQIPQGLSLRGGFAKRVPNNPNHLQLTEDSSVKHLSAAKKKSKTE